MQYSIISYNHHDLFYNWKFVPFEPLHPFIHLEAGQCGKDVPFSLSKEPLSALALGTILAAAIVLPLAVGIAFLLSARHTEEWGVCVCVCGLES